ncbi:MAG: oligoribonuclease [Dehalococcoidia bacterium]|nr:oligoribonuclease [Dehalococcoidia bacterium]
MSPTSRRDPTHLAWIDLEMTGLDPERNVIIEIATLVTDRDLNILAEGPCLAIARTEEELARMDAWNVKTHTGSGLLNRIRTEGVTVAEAEHQTLIFLRKWLPKGASPLAGNSIAQDRRFLRREMPKIEAFLHYRNVDVSTLKELVRRWYPAMPPAEKKQAHQALDDIRESVAELQYYHSLVFRTPDEVTPPPPVADGVPPA